MTAETPLPEPGHILYIIPCPPDADDPTSPTSLVLEVPLSDLKELVYRPVRWMQLVAWGVLNCTGEVLKDNGDPLHQDSPLALLGDGATYRFAPVIGSTFSLINLEHTRTRCSKHSSSAASIDYNNVPAPADRASVLNARDEQLCIFSGRTPVERAHIIPEAFSQNRFALRKLAGERNFGFTHHLDHRNTLSLLSNLHSAWDKTKEGFILATDDNFIRDQDVPPATGEAQRKAPWLARAQVQGVTYIWQSPTRLVPDTSYLIDAVRFNERARFANIRPEWRPSARAINYVYAAGMFKLYLRKDERVLDLLSRAVPFVPDTASDDDTDDDDPSDDDEQSNGSGKRRKLDDKSYVGNGWPTHGEGPVTRGRARPTRPHTPTDMSPMDMLHSLRNTPAFTKLNEQRLQGEKAESLKRLDEWLESSAVVHV